MELVTIDYGWTPDIRQIIRIDPCAFIISKNIHRRHLTKAQQADLIVAAMKANDDFARVARSFSASGKRGGSTKDAFKQSAVKEGAKHSISTRTMERAIAKDRGPVIERKR